MAGLGLSVISWMTLVRMWRESLNAGQLMEEALRDVAPNETNISYGPAGARNQLDIWRRSDLPSDGRAPVIVQVHGGAWVIGNKQQQAMPLLAHLAERGWVGVSINYRLSPRATWPDHIIDVKRALAWVKANIAEHGGDPDFVAITGGSAGGHLCSLAALSPNEPEFQPGFEEADTSVVAAVPFYGVYDWTNRDGTGRADMEPMLARFVLKNRLADARDVWEFASTMTWVRPDAPPFMIIHGANDTLVPVEQARSFAAMLRAESKEPVVYVELPGAQHAYELFDSPRTLFTLDAVDRFLEAVRVQAGHLTRAEEAGVQGPAVLPLSRGSSGGERSVVPGEGRPVRVALLQERVATFGCLVGHVGQPGCFAREHLLSHQAIVDEVERELQHSLGGRALAHHFSGPLQTYSFQLGVVDHRVDHPHSVGVFGAVGIA